MPDHIHFLPLICGFQYMKEMLSYIHETCVRCKSTTQAILNYGNKSTLLWDVTIFTSSYVSMTGYMEKNKNDDDTVQAGIKRTDI
jgi:hypothetical protein